MDLTTEKRYWRKRCQWVIGIDEAGRGPLAGPISVSAVLINQKLIKKYRPDIKKLLEHADDSKKLTGKRRVELYRWIKRCSAIKFHQKFISEKQIDKIGIDQATFKAMKICAENIIDFKKIKNNHIILIDGNRVFENNSKYHQATIIKGDGKVFSIALASIVAKVARDNRMKKLAKKYPQYKFEIHKGYPTPEHIKLIKTLGVSPIHRKSFYPVSKLVHESVKIRK